ncbi:hypothetical protein JRO89_XS04G0021900 [Xanthoceras sorbifolium]|uniref:RNA helicase n=1 Tax=Xanthoceras sorbifolium TaxID=99658 RepID=A0ABQ8I3V7_9ROSI|nr:hypothetical protein JRO89_XS04G0021900 [Xanthoceras sorbifolium]
MPALVSTRLLLLVGDSLPFYRLSHVSRMACYRNSVRFLSRISSGDREPLTLASLGVKREFERAKKSRADKVEKQSPTVEVAKSKMKVGRSDGIKAVGVRKSFEIDSAPFAAKSFSELGLPPLLLERLEREGLMVPTDVQAAAIPTVLKNHDVVIQSYTGSGKTLAYLLPILSKVGPLKNESSNSDKESGKRTEIEAVIVAPSRELGMQIVREFERLLGPSDKKVVQQLVGGANRSRQEEALKKNKPAIVVGTPGRIAEISAAGKLHTHGCRFLVLDEIDELLSFNFRESIHRILEHVGTRPGADSRGPKNPLASQAGRQTIMVSATVPFSVIRAAKSWGHDPLLVQARNVTPLDSVGASGPLQHKVDTLRRCVHALDAQSVIAFMNHSKQLKDAVFKLEARGMKAAELHGDLGKLGRSTTLKKFKNGEVRVLVTNELSARGLDVAECDLVINIDLPTDSIHYAHRAGRTGRLGRKGTVVTICEEREVFVMNKMQKQLGVPISACDFTEGKLVIADLFGYVIGPSGISWLISQSHTREDANQRLLGFLDWIQPKSRIGNPEMVPILAIVSGLYYGIKALGLILSDRKAVFVDEDTFAKASLSSEQARTIKVLEQRVETLERELDAAIGAAAHARADKRQAEAAQKAAELRAQEVTKELENTTKVFELHMEELRAKQQEISKRDEEIKLLEAIIQTLGGKESRSTIG